jgi:hypothetical protein
MGQDPSEEDTGDGTDGMEQGRWKWVTTHGIKQTKRNRTRCPNSTGLDLPDLKGLARLDRDKLDWTGTYRVVPDKLEAWDSTGQITWDRSN